MRKIIFIAFGIALLLLGIGLLIPYQTVLAPEWRVQVIDNSGKPYVGQKVRQFCSDYTLDINLCTDRSAAQFTDQNGYVIFPERTYSSSTVVRLLATLKKSIFRYLAHGSVGTSVYLDSSGPAGYATLEYTADMQEPPAIFLLKSENISK